MLPQPGVLSTVIGRPPIKHQPRRDRQAQASAAKLRVTELSACSNALKIACCLSAGMPMPVSRTAKCSTPRCYRVRCSRTSSTTSPRARELDGVSQQIDQRPAAAGAGRPQGHRGRPGKTWQANSSPSSGAAAPAASTTSPSSVAQREGRLLQFQLAGLDLREIENVVDDAEQRIGRRLDHVQVLRAVRGVRFVSSASSVIPRMPFIGVRISWLMFARNSLLARLAASAASLERQFLAGVMLLGDVAGDGVEQPGFLIGISIPEQMLVGTVGAAIAVLK